MKKTLILIFALMLTCSIANSQGTYHFATPIGGAGQENMRKSFHYDMYHYVCGSFNSATMDIDPRGTPNILNNMGSADGFWACYDTAGQMLSYMQIGAGMNQQVNDIFADASGIYVCGYYQDTVDFDPGPGTFNLTGSMTQFNGFVAKFYPSGGLIWAKSISSWSQANALCLTTGGALAVVGHFGGTIDADPGPGVVNHSTNGGHDCFYVELNANNGNYIQSASWGGIGIDRAYDVAKMNGTVVIAGAYTDTVDFNPGSGVYVVNNTAAQAGFVLNLSSSLQFNWVNTTLTNITEFKNLAEHPSSVQVAAASDSYIRYFDMAGNVLWSHDLGPTVYMQSLLINYYGNILAGGILGGPIDFDPGAGYCYISGVNGFWSEFTSSSGDFQYIKTIPGYVNIAGMGYTADGRFDISGTFMDSVDFNPASGVDMHYSNTANIYDIFIAQYDGCTPAIATYSGNLCTGDTIILGGMHFTCVEFSTANPQLVCIEQNLAYSGTQTFSWLDDSEGSDCDTARFVTLTPQRIYNSTQTLTICGGDSVVVGNFVHTTSGTYVDILTAVSGCDSTITTNLTVNTVDTSLTVSWSTLYSNAAGATYQWIDCSTGTPIPGATSFSYTATVDGEYACIVTQNSCTDTSSCYTLVGVGISETGSSLFHVYPNPASYEVNIRSKQQIENVRLLDIAGRELLIQHVNTDSAKINLESISPGTYIIEVKTDFTVGQHIIIKQ